MVEQVENVGGPQILVGANKLPLSDEVRASLQAVRAAQEAARARVRREIVRTRAWFGAIVGVIGLGAIFLGPRVGGRVAAPKTAVAATSRVASPPSPVSLPKQPLIAPAAAVPTTLAPVVVARSTGSIKAPAEAAAEAPASTTALAVRAMAEPSASAGGCDIATGQPRWRVDPEACAKAFELRPNDAALALTIAHAHHAKGHLAQAGEWAKRAIALNARSAEAFVILARAEARAGHPAASAQAYRTYIELAPRGWHAAEARAALAN